MVPEEVEAVIVAVEDMVAVSVAKVVLAVIVVV